MPYQFEMIEKRETREIVTRSDDIWAFLIEAANALAPRPGEVGKPRLSGARGEIEIGRENGPQILIRVL